MTTYVLLLSLLTGSGANSSMAPTFTTKELCEAARDAYAKQASERDSFKFGTHRTIAVCARAS